MKFPLKDPCGKNDLAFTLYAMDIEERRDRMERAARYLRNFPDTTDDVQFMFELTDEEWVYVRESFIVGGGY